MQQFTQQFRDIPVGIVNNILDMITLVAEISSVVYRDAFDLDCSSMYTSILKDEYDKVDIAISYYIDDEMTYSFDVFLNKYVDTLLEQYKALKKCWSLAND